MLPNIPDKIEETSLSDSHIMRKPHEGSHSKGATTGSYCVAARVMTKTGLRIRPLTKHIPYGVLATRSITKAIAQSLKKDPQVELDRIYLPKINKESWNPGGSTLNLQVGTSLQAPQMLTPLGRNSPQLGADSSQWSLPSPKLTWKLIEGPIWRIVVLQGPLLHFHVNLEECEGLRGLVSTL